MDEEIIRIQGKFLKCRYASDSYAVYLFSDGEEKITVCGPLVDIDPQFEYSLYGNYYMHPRYGFQFQVDHFEKMLPSERDEAVRFLSGGFFKGIGEKTAVKIVNVLGEHALDILKEEPEAIEDLPLTAKQKTALREGIAGFNDPYEEERMRLLNAGFGRKEINLLFSHFEQDYFAVTEEDPYQLFYDVYGIGFTKVDRYALNTGVEETDLRRKTALLIHLFEDRSFQTGNTYLFYDEFVSRYDRESGFHDGDFVLENALRERLLVEEGERYYRHSDWLDECLIAERLKEYAGHETEDPDWLEEEITALEDENGIVYSEQQYEAISAFFKNDFSIITGGPGTGKTTLVKALVDLSRKRNPYDLINVAAPTGRAAKRINELCDVESKTIHSLLGWDKETNRFNFNDQNPLMLDILIIDEFSMVDNQLFASVLRASGAVKKICVIGDKDQLPSIRPGDVLNDLLSSGCFVSTALSANFRQRRDNEIIALAGDMLRGETDFGTYKKDVVFLETGNPENVLLEKIDELQADGVELDEIQVLSPMYKGGAGIDSLNHLLQEYYNPGERDRREIKNGPQTLRVNDKILQLKNQPMDDVYNGDIGILKEIDYATKSVMVLFDRNFVSYPFDDLSPLTLAYALSVHKSQGSEYPYVFLIVSRYHQRMLEKKLLYTAVTRAKSRLYILGDRQVFADALKRERPKRNTGLLDRLTNAGPEFPNPEF